MSPKTKTTTSKSASSKKVQSKAGKVESQKPKKGRFIVIDGIDGAGKATQTKLLVEAMRKQGKKVEAIDFPRYYDNFFGGLIGECLRGDYGDFIGIHPKIASVLYGCDRMESSAQINKWLAEGKTVIADRFVSSNQIHQGGKCKTDKERKEFLSWLDKMEHEVLGVPRPDLIIYLNLPIEVSQMLLAKAKAKENAKAVDYKKRYMKGKSDMAEENLQHMEDSRQSALKIIKAKNNWKKIECFVKGNLRSIEDIHGEVVKVASAL